MAVITGVLTADPRNTPPGTDYSMATGQATLWKDAWRRFRANKLAMIGTAVFMLVVIVAIVSIFWTPYTIYDQGLGTLTDGLSLQHPLGLDSLGRDELSLIMIGAQTTIEVGVLTALVCSVIGISAGLVAGYFGGRVDWIISLITYVGFGMPSLLIAFFILFLTNRPSIVIVVLSLSASGWMPMTRLVRGQTLALREREFVRAARASGTKDLMLMIRHILPNALGPIIVQATFLIPEAILFEAFLSYLGLGLPAPDASWGALVSSGLQDRFLTYTTMIFPSIALLITLMSANFIGDGLRDALDPRSVVR
jgi:ABC-type dipeptide/oligopeptide/nickel transport system permease subunit